MNSRFIVSGCLMVALFAIHCLGQAKWEVGIRNELRFSSSKITKLVKIRSHDRTSQMYINSKCSFAYAPPLGWRIDSVKEFKCNWVTGPHVRIRISKIDGSLSRIVVLRKKAQGVMVFSKPCPNIPYADTKKSLIDLISASFQ